MLLTQINKYSNLKIDNNNHNNNNGNNNMIIICKKCEHIENGKNIE